MTQISVLLNISVLYQSDKLSKPESPHCWNPWGMYNTSTMNTIIALGQVLLWSAISLMTLPNRIDNHRWKCNLLLTCQEPLNKIPQTQEQPLKLKSQFSTIIFSRNCNLMLWCCSKSTSILCRPFLDRKIERVASNN